MNTLDRVPNASPAPRRTARSARRFLKSNWTLRAISLVIVLAAWEIQGRRMNRATFASPGRTVEAFRDFVTEGVLLKAWKETLFVLVVALSIAAVTGIVLGFLFGWFNYLDKFFQPLVQAIFVTPKIALLPIIAVWLGFGDSAKIAVVFLFAFFEIFFTIRNGVHAIDVRFVTVARAYMIPEGMLLTRVVLPATVPYMITGLRLGLLHGMVGVVLVGFFLEFNGIGGLISIEAFSHRVPGVFAAMISVAVFGVAINEGLRYAERRIAPWAHRELE